MSFDLPRSVRPARPYPLPAGTVLFRNHHVDHPGARFNPCLGEPTRFAPLNRPDGTCIPTFYAATSFDASAYETLFRGTPSPVSGIPRQELDTRGVSRIATRKDLGLVPLFTPELLGLGLDPQAVFRPSQLVYPRCRRLAEMAWRDNPAAHGMIWTSVRDNSAQAMVLFGDRLDGADFDEIDTRTIATDASLLDALEAAGARAGFRIQR